MLHWCFGCLQAKAFSNPGTQRLSQDNSKGLLSWKGSLPALPNKIVYQSSCLFSYTTYFFKVSLPLSLLDCFIMSCYFTAALDNREAGRAKKTVLYFFHTLAYLTILLLSEFHVFPLDMWNMASDHKQGCSHRLSDIQGVKSAAEEDYV